MSADRIYPNYGPTCWTRPTVDDLGANLIEVQHVRDCLDLRVRDTGGHVALEIRGLEHADSLLSSAKADGYNGTAITSRDHRENG